MADGRDLGIGQTAHAVRYYKRAEATWVGKGKIECNDSSSGRANQMNPVQSEHIEKSS